jgi:murein DD-endopeptidase MepM/ murein hydrolase activator NlpD
VDFGDSVFAIAKQFNITPETILWANYDQLDDNPDMLSPGMELNIPPVDGVYYQLQEGDTLEVVSLRFEADPEAVLNWPGNGLDLVEPQILPGRWLMVPGGHREFRQWLVPTIPRGAAGVSKSLYGPGACEGSYDGAYGSGTFIYPTANHTLSGNDYWSGHLGIDLAAGGGAAVVAADSGVVVFSGWANGGYGYMVMIDHGNGYQTLYAHLSGTRANCGQSVGQGTPIGSAGSTGNSTGAHLHFEVRFQGGFVSPWFVLPSP